MKSYTQFLKEKRFSVENSGFEVSEKNLNPALFDFQKAILLWALKKGRAAIFADCGLGKTIMQLEWARHVAEHTKKPVLILAPLAVSEQTKEEGKKFGISVTKIAEQSEIQPGINITNYEKLHKFDVSVFSGVVLDESSILKSFTGKMRNMLIDLFQKTPYKLACTATPAPNDFMELGNHCEFLNVMTRNEMLSMFFINDASNTGTWRLKHHSVEDFWRFVGMFAVVIQKPSDLGFKDRGFSLPPLQKKPIILDVDEQEKETLFVEYAQGFQEVKKARQESLLRRVQEIKKLIHGSKDQWIIWCDYNAEGEMLRNMIPNCVEIKGSDTNDFKEKTMMDFVHGKVQILVSKSKICGYGMNFQNCHNVVFCGVSYSYENYYQATRRCWRFGQKHPVNVYLVLSEKEYMALQAIEEKEKQHQSMQSSVCSLAAESFTSLFSKPMYKKDIQKHSDYVAMLGDSIERVKEIPDNSIGYSIFSPPFSDLYTYSNSERDLGNSKNDEEFFEHFSFLAKDIYRILEPGRLMSVHCMLLPLKKFRDGYIGLKDFRGDLIRLFQDLGFIFSSEVTIWKDPVVQMQRTKALNLLHKQLKKDSSMSSQGLPDYLITFRKPGENKNPIKHTNTDFPVGEWQKIASPIWMDIRQSNTLQRFSARDEKDERHICPLQLEVIERCLYLWSNPGDTVFSPFMGIGSEGYSAIKLGRKFIGIELKESYYKQATLNLEAATKLNRQLTLV